MIIMPKNLVQKLNVSMGRINQIFVFILIILSVVKQANSQELTPTHGIAIRQLGIEENFKGFSYGVDDKDRNRLTVSINPGAFEGKNLIGIALNLGKNGAIEFIEPIFKQEVKGFEPIRWGIDSFKRKQIDINAFWQIVRSSIDEGSSDVEVLFFVVNTIKATDGFPPLDQILLPEFGPLAKSIETIKISKGLKDGPKIETLAALDDFLNHR